MKCPKCNVEPVVSRRRDGSKSTCPECGLEEIHFARFKGQDENVTKVDFGEVHPPMDLGLAVNPLLQTVTLEFGAPVQRYVMTRKGIEKLIAILVQAESMLDDEKEKP